ncbi:MAG: hypothetical protein HY301_17760 [Verrucomicrobia bacterium]|nr:hypothetical protein [Verrucomicrobiota bacterium]
MNEREQLLMLAYVDGELNGRELRATEDLITSSAEARALATELRMSHAVLSANEPEAVLPVSKDFYWSQIARKIECAEAQPSPSLWERLSQPAFWLRYVTPVVATAAVAIVAVVGFNRANTDGGETEAPATETSSVVFRSDAEKMTVIWLQTDENSDFTDPDAEPKL